MLKMNFYTNKRQWKAALLILAVLIGAFSLSYTNQLVEKMKEEERKRILLWAEATSILGNDDDLGESINFYLNVITNNTTIPVILTDGDDQIIGYANLGKDSSETAEYQKKRLLSMKSGREPIIINFIDGGVNYIYYEDSTILKQLAVYPYVQLSIIAFFIIISYIAFSASRKSEQNQVWVGMSKETAHQLGTPISSLMAWIEILEQTTDNKQYLEEMQKDIRRLEMVAERFSKIGSLPELKVADLTLTLDSAVDYMKSRTSKNIQFKQHYNTHGPVLVPLSKSLFHWVIENLVKNAVDAMDGKGTISIYLTQNDKEAIVEITDTGKGIPKSKQKTIFNPGYTSKERGWGLGLSLVKRIIENYHRGKITVASSEIEKGTTFKIVVPK
jgi:signal transduction histidine kinase